MGVLVEVGFSLIPVNQGVWGRALTGRKFKIINLATPKASLQSKKQNLKIVNVLTQRTPDAMQNNGLAQIDANDRDLDRR